MSQGYFVVVVVGVSLWTLSWAPTEIKGKGPRNNENEENQPLVITDEPVEFRVEPVGFQGFGKLTDRFGGI